MEPPAPTEEAAVSDLRAALEAAIAEDFDDLASHAAYADYLVDQGDPRGEFVQVQLALEKVATTDERHPDLWAREKALLDAHQAEWFGELAPFVRVESRRDGFVNRVTWRRGWLYEVRINGLELPVARALVRSRAAAILRRLDVRGVSYEYSGDPEEDDVPDNSEHPSMHHLRKAPFVPHLKFFRLGEPVDFEKGRYNCHARGEGLVDLIERTRALEELEVYAWGCEPERLFALPNLTRLRSLIFYHHDGPHPLHVLADNPAFSALQTLRIHPAHTRDGTSYLPRAEVVRLLNSPYLTSLRNLHLHASDLGDVGCEEIVNSGILKRLRILDLNHGRITDAGARVLAECPDVRNLELLGLNNNQLGDDSEDFLPALGIKVRDAEQQEVGSDEYLWTGDVE
jgi:uncharacterized protein (TIGR02996 family)